jgi:predicted alpha-1,2-mannosidase
VVDKQTIRGFMRCTPEGGGWGNGDGHPDYTVYFYAQFSKLLTDYGFWTADIPGDWKRRREDITSGKYQKRVSEADIIRNINELEGKHIGFFTEFSTTEGETVTFKAGISFVDMEGAEKNFKAELANASFEEIYESARKKWDEALGKISVEGGTADERTVFYTALYHTMIDPRLFSDVDGRYPGGDRKIHKSERYNRRTIFSGWDVFRSQFPLQTIINQQLINDEINSFIDLAEESGQGYYERWEFLNAYSGCMLGNPAISVLTDAYMKGIRDYDIAKAYQIALNTSKRWGNNADGFSPGNISETLEYAYSDWCMSVLAKELGKMDDYNYYAKRARNYEQTFDKATGWFRPRNADGSWRDLPKNRTSSDYRLQHDYGSVESNPYQQGWFVPHDIEGMAALMGGRAKTLADLTSFFENTPDNLLWNDYYNHANEPVHHIPFLFNRLGAARLTQKWTRHICRNAYFNKVEGLVGNEDVGQMSAWYVLAASGIHPVCPGETRFEITTPVFNRVTFKLGNGKQFSIVTHNNSPENVYIQSIKLNGKRHDKFHIDYQDIMKGGTMEIVVEKR